MLGVTVRLMSDGELSRLEVLRDLDGKRLTTKAAAQLLGFELMSPVTDPLFANSSVLRTDSSPYLPSPVSFQ